MIDVDAEVKEAARRLAAPARAEGFVGKAIHTYRDAVGKPLYHKLRSEHPQTGAKCIRPMYRNGAGFVLGEPAFPAGKPLYRLDAIAKASAGTEVFIVEGEKAADALAALGVLVTTSGGADSADRADWMPLKCLRPVVWRDNDAPGQKYAFEVEQRLRAIGCDVVHIDVEALELPAKGDAHDWCQQNREATGQDVARLPRCSNAADMQSGPSKESTGEPEPLPTIPPVRRLDFNHLPAVMRTYVGDIADRMQCPPDFVAVATITMIGAAIGRLVGIRPKEVDSWTVVPNQWCLLVGRSGVMKSPALSEAIAPLKRMQALAFETHAEAMRAHDIEKQVEKLRFEDRQRQAKDKLRKFPGSDVATILAADNAKPEPIAKRFIVNDSTVEALAETLAENPNGILLERDELVGWLRALDKEGQQEARAFYLTAADGDKSFTVDRILRGRGRHVEALCVSIIGSIQPGVLATYVRETQRGGAGDDGLLQRFGLMVYPDISPGWINVDRAPDQAARDEIRDLVERMCSLTPEAIEAERDPHGGIPFLRFANDAQQMFTDWRTEHETKVRSADEHPAIVSHLSKYRKLVPGLALIFHLADNGHGPVAANALARALLFAEYLESHARRVYSFAARPEFDAARTLIARIRAGKLGASFTARDVYRKGWAGLTTADETDAALRVLSDYGYVSTRQVQATGMGRPSVEFLAHPKLARPT